MRMKLIRCCSQLLARVLFYINGVVNWWNSLSRCAFGKHTIKIIMRELGRKLDEASICVFSGNKYATTGSANQFGKPTD